MIIFLSISLNMCFGCSKELSHRDSSFVYPKHMFWLKNKKTNFQLCTLIWEPDMGYKVPKSHEQTHIKCKHGIYFSSGCVNTEDLCIVPDKVSHTVYNYFIPFCATVKTITP